jgi:hypothetical protein
VVRKTQRVTDVLANKQRLAVLVGNNANIRGFKVENLNRHLKNSNKKGLIHRVTKVAAK